MVGRSKIVKTVRIPGLLLKGSLKGICCAKVVALLIEAHTFVRVRLYKSATAAEQTETNYADHGNTGPQSTKQKSAVSQCIVLHHHAEDS